MEKTLLVRPGSKADIVVNIDYMKEVIDVRRSVIYDLIDENIILSQTTPPISSLYIDKDVAVTYLVRENNEHVRYGVYGKVVELLKDYELASSDTVPALVIRKNGEPEKYNVRMHFRVKLGLDRDLALSLEGESVNIVDISIGGVKINHRTNFNMQPRTLTKGILTIDGEDFVFQARVMRVWKTPASKKADSMEFMALKFISLNIRLENILGKKIREIERITRLKELGYESRDP